MTAPHLLSDPDYDRLLAVSPAHHPIFEAMRLGVLFLPIKAGAAVADPQAIRDPWIAIVGDDLERSRGPGAFDIPGLRRLARAASGLIRYSGAADARIYGVAAAIALLSGRVLIVETQIPHHAAWYDAVTRWAPRVPFLDVSPIEGRA